MILVDTDVVVWLTRGRREALDWMVQARQGGEVLAISAITLTEIAGTMRSAERQAVTRLLMSLAPIPVTSIAAWRASEYRRLYRRSHASISVPDYVIAATASVEGLPLATLNVKHYPMFPDLRPPFVVAPA